MDENNVNEAFANFENGTNPVNDENTADFADFGGLFDGVDIEKLLELIALLSNPMEDKNIDFLLALKPVLSDTNAPKVEKAVRLMKLYDTYLKLKESGMLSAISGLI
jgi:hypothetical protein